MKRQSADFVDAERPLKLIKSTNSNSDSEYWEREYRKQLANSKDAQTVRDIWQEARNYISLNQIHLTTALKACQNDSGVAMQIMRETRQDGLQPNIFHFTCLLRIPGTPTKKILKRMEKDSIEGNHWSWNAALTGCPAEEVWDIFGQVPRPDRYAIASLLKKCSSPQEVLRAFKAAKKHGVQFDRAILNAAVSAAPEIFAECIHQIQLQNPKIQPDLKFFNIVLNKVTWSFKVTMYPKLSVIGMPHTIVIKCILCSRGHLASVVFFGCLHKVDLSKVYIPISIHRLRTCFYWSFA